MRPSVGPFDAPGQPVWFSASLVFALNNSKRQKGRGRSLRVGKGKEGTPLKCGQKRDWGPTQVGSGKLSLDILPGPLRVMRCCRSPRPPGAPRTPPSTRPPFSARPASLATPSPSLTVALSSCVPFFRPCRDTIKTSHKQTGTPRGPWGTPR
jgi:hypothetical protein